jgi:hypothetical protein
MTNDNRATIAYIAGYYISNRKPTSVYDRISSKYISMTGSNMDGDKITIYNNNLRCSFSISKFGAKYNIRNQKDNSSIELTISGSTFKGYDYKSSKFYEGRVMGTSISIHDYETSQHYEYSIS